MILRAVGLERYRAAVMVVAYLLSAVAGVAFAEYLDYAEKQGRVRHQVEHSHHADFSLPDNPWPEG